ncbi:hypothetical protein EVAR_75604_1 [Eumeta japonica]|uniref:Uncharacterized protein n=1 Tax=Eumeta variegata TaxID=151549 RepID=A0A4C1TZZ0_EUMVA|nr:hypothetical protein EVAR_75604_1 [Eumeta japonica]
MRSSTAPVNKTPKMRQFTPTLLRLNMVSAGPIHNRCEYSCQRLVGEGSIPRWSSIDGIITYSQRFEHYSGIVSEKGSYITKYLIVGVCFTKRHMSCTMELKKVGVV